MFAICLVFIHHGWSLPAVYQFGWAKFWRMALDLPNLPKFSPPPFCAIRYVVTFKWLNVKYQLTKTFSNVTYCCELFSSSTHLPNGFEFAYGPGMEIFCCFVLNLPSYEHHNCSITNCSIGMYSCFKKAALIHLNYGCLHVLLHNSFTVCLDPHLRTFS